MEASAWLVRTRHEAEQGSYVARTNVSVREYLDSWLDGKKVLHENTREGYRIDLKPVYDRFGHLALQELTPEMLIALKKEMRTTVGRKGQGRSTRTINLMLTVLNVALEAATDAGLLRINVASESLLNGRRVRISVARHGRSRRWLPSSITSKAIVTRRPGRFRCAGSGAPRCWG
jgi:hypothetical protein